MNSDLPSTPIFSRHVLVGRLDVFSRHIALTVLVTLAVTFFVFAPRLWTIRENLAGRMPGGRALGLILQTENPFRRDVEPALQMRVLPPLVAHALGLGPVGTLAIPLVGAVALSAYVAVLLRRRLADGRFVLGGSLLFATTSATLVPLHWPGLNDAWVWLGLLAVSFGRASWALPLACLLCPWIDERFVIGFPLAWIVRQLDRGEPVFTRSTLLGAWLLPYAALRAGIMTIDSAGTAASRDFLRDTVGPSLKLLPRMTLGWWMGLRAGWLPLVFAVAHLSTVRRRLPLLVLFGTLFVSFLLASDLSRSVAIIAPFMLLGCFEFARRYPDLAPAALLLLAAVNFILPAMHVVHVRSELINPLPVELYRLFRPVPV